MWETIKTYLEKFFNNRLRPITVVYILLLSILVNRMFVLQIAKVEKYETAADNLTQKTRLIKATRGKIYDCNGKLLAYNKLSYNVVLKDYDEINNMESEEKNSLIYYLIRLIESNKDTIDIDFGITMNKNGKMEYSLDGNPLLLFKSEVFAVKNGIQGLTDEQKEMDARELFEYLREEKKANTTSFGIDEKYDDKTALKIMAIRYALFINRYKEYMPIVVSKNIKNETVAAIEENSMDLPGVDISQDTTRKYKKSKYFAHMLGYTGTVSDEKLEELNKNNKGDEYTSEDQVGISGLESTFEKYLRGKKGKEKLVVDANTSNVITYSSVEAPEAGNDLYLTIDADLQEECYKLLEEHIAGILVSKITQGTDAGTRGHSSKDIKVPIYDVYNALICNNIVNPSRFTDSAASPLEKKTYKKFKRKRKVIFKKMRKYLAYNSNKTNDDLTKYNKDFLEYFYEFIRENEIIKSSKIKTSDSYYRDYKNDRISLSKFLQHCISKNMVDLSLLKVGDNYYSTEEIYEKLLDYTFKQLEKDNKFSKKIYSYLIYHYELSGKDICLMLFDQGDIKYNEHDYQKLKRGVISSYSFIMKKLKKLEITPGELGLDPCSGSVVITDVKTGDVKAMVTYPSYDNNKMANQVDSEYFYTYLTENSSSPLINRPTQQKLAPGSTFKVVSSIAGMEEGVITPDSRILDKTVFTEITPSPKDWTTVSHGNINVSQAIGVSCNYFFYTVGYRLAGTYKGTVNNKRGLSRLKKYAEMFGLTDKSGVEVQETEPSFSTTDIVRTAIGQATNSYTPVQLSRYITTVANKGTCYNLTLIDKVKDINGKTVLKKKPDVRNKVEINDSSWTAVHKGMRLVVNGPESSINEYFDRLKVDVAGKTGTAQQTTLHANHAYFVSFAPYNKPKICVTTVIPNGYASANAAYAASDIYKYYFSSRKKKVSGGIKVDSDAKVTD
ncbi:MAG: peptidase [Lachnospiraceae bacterium]|nr:peptidase [Lachnospiraceae bacterium]